MIKYRLSAFGQISVLNISQILVIFSDISVKDGYIDNLSVEYQLLVSVKHRTDKILVIGFGQISVIGYWLNLTDMPSPDIPQLFL